ncbi:MAG: Hsp20/alpha crystallin family protein [Verrucomicrobiota bacterium]
MKLRKYNTFITDPFVDFDRLFQHAFNANRLQGFFDQHSTGRSFRVDVYQDGDGAHHVVAELPGVVKEDVDVQLEKSVLTITAKRRQKDGEQENSHTLQRSLNVSDDTDSAQVTASLKDGILQVTLPKAEARKPKSIAVS